MKKTTGKIPVSCFIVASNEEERIAKTIGSVIGWVDEVILIDGGSTDKTVEIAEQLGARTLFNKWPGYGPQKRFGEQQCRNDWLLNLDADEVVTPALQQEICALFKDGPPPDAGYHLYVVDILPGRNRPLPLARKYNIVRLYDGSKMRYSRSQVHDRVETKNQPLGQLGGLIHHHSVLSISQAIIKLNRYSDLQTETLAPKAVWKLQIRLITEFPVNFLRFYIFRGYFMGGAAGFTYTMVNASFRFFRVAKMLEKVRLQQRGKEQDIERQKREEK